MILNNNKNKELLRGLERGEKEAFEEVYKKFVDKIYRFVFFKVGGREAAEDLTSLIFLKMWNHLQENGIGEEKNLGPFIYKIARNAIIDHYRKEGSKKDVSIDDGFDIAQEADSLEDKVDQEIKGTIVMKKMMKLKDEYREILLMRFSEDYSIGEIAEITGKTKGSVRVIIHRALKALKEMVDQEELDGHKK